MAGIAQRVGVLRCVLLEYSPPSQQRASVSSPKKALAFLMLLCKYFRIGFVNLPAVPPAQLKYRPAHSYRF
jgi:hypothetical protein